MSAQRLVRALLEVGVDVFVACPTGESSVRVRSELGGRLSVLELPGHQRWSLPRRLRKWRQHARAAVEASEAVVVHGQGLLSSGIAATDVRGIPRVVTAHGNLAVDTRALYNGLGGVTRSWLRERLSTSVIKRADVIIGVNPEWSVNLPRRPRRFLYIPNIIDERFYAPHVEPEPALVLFVGGSRAIKGWQLLADAWPAVRKAVPEARLHMVGWSPEDGPAVGPAHQNSVALEGWVSSEELAARMARASVLVIPSQFEVAPTVLAEAWAVGLPVVATAVGGVRAFAAGAAILVQRREPEGLAAGIVSALAGGPQVDRLVKEGRRRAEAHRAQAVANAHLALYTELIERAAK